MESKYVCKVIVLSAWDLHTSVVDTGVPLSLIAQNAQHAIQNGRQNMTGPRIKGRMNNQ